MRDDANTHGVMPSSRKHIHATNRYNKNGFMMTTSQSSEHDSQEQNLQEDIEEPNSNKDSKNSADISSSMVEPQKLLANDMMSPNNQRADNDHLNINEYDDTNYHNQKTIEQVNMRLIQQAAQKNGQSKTYQENAVGAAASFKQMSQFTDRRMDTSGVDIQFGSDIASPLANRMMPNYQVKIMKNLKAGNFEGQ